MDSPLFHAFHHIALFLQNIWIAWKRRPDVFICKKRALNSLVLFPDGVALKISPNGWLPQQGHATRNPVHFPPNSQNIIHFNLCLLCSSLSLLKKYEQDLLLNWSKCYREHAAFNAKFCEILQHISHGRLNCTI